MDDTEVAGDSLPRTGNREIAPTTGCLSQHGGSRTWIRGSSGTDAARHAGGRNAETGHHAGHDVLGAPLIYGCHIGEALGVPGALSSPHPDAYPRVTPSEGVEMGPPKEALSTNGGSRLEAIHCQATQSILSYTCNQEGRVDTVKLEQFRQPCGVSATICREAAVTCVLKIGAVEQAMDMNMTRSHGGEARTALRRVGYERGSRKGNSPRSSWRSLLGVSGSG